MPAPGGPEAEFSSPFDIAVARQDAETLDMVREALAKRQTMLAYQPVVASGDPAKPVFYEGLIRVLDRRGRIIPAGDFMAVSETQELGRMLDANALRLGLEALERVPKLRLSINMSARSIGYPQWIDTLREALARKPEIGKRLILEITESSAIIMPDIVQVFMQDMQRRGVTFALDDFGAGFTAFRHLRDFYFDFLKIDGEFTRKVASDPDNQVLAEAMIAVGRVFDMITVAEAVETPADAEFLRRAGCDFMQGYCFGAPTTRPAWDSQQRRA
ncbi:MAG: EAL domain-containing protein [Alphaproteobacteria bacterium]|nr:MAG: EAL domain-containing protein [Alphaproteobacteria bacterium]